MKTSTFVWLLVLILAVGAGIYFIIHSSNTSSVEVEKQKEAPKENPKPIQLAQNTPPKEPPQQQNDETHKMLREANALFEQNKYYEARELFVRVYQAKDKLADSEREYVKQRMIAINQNLIFSKDELRDAEIYTVVHNDNLTKIAKKFKTEAGQIMFVNKLSTDALQLGDKLKILKGKFHIRVECSKFVLQLLYNGSFVKEYKVAIGKEDRKEDRTPLGKFTIGKKIKNPDWEPRDPKTGKVIKILHGDPRNLLGSRWMAFKNPSGELTSYGIHGTTDEASIGTKASNGCVRMRDQDVTELYDIVPVETEVEIAE